MAAVKVFNLEQSGSARSFVTESSEKGASPLSDKDHHMLLKHQ
jgi:hypothetical protein